MTYTIAGKQVGKVGYGLMGLTAPGKALSDADAIAAIKAALNAGSNYVNGGEFYGPPGSNSLNLLNKYFEQYPEDADKLVVNIKGALGPDYTPTGDKKSVSQSIERCLQALGPRGKIDQFEAARKDPKVPIEETLGTIQSFVDAGKIGGISVSELNLESLREAAEKFTIVSLEIELSLFRTDPLTNGILEFCAEHDIAVLAYSPLGRGFLGGEIKSFDDLPENDMRRHSPRFFRENFDNNIELVRKIEAFAERKGCTTGQVAIGWLLSLSDRQGMPKIIPIPGSGNPKRIQQNSSSPKLSEPEMAEIDEILKHFVPAGDRYPSLHMKWVDA